MSVVSRTYKTKFVHPNPDRKNIQMCQADIVAGKKCHWTELELTGKIRHISPAVWEMNLSSLYLNDNNLCFIPPEISRLKNLITLDLSKNKLRSLPSELGDLYHLKELLLDFNFLRVLPYELGKLFNLQKLGLVGNPLSPDLQVIYDHEPFGTAKLLMYLLDRLPGVGDLWELSLNIPAPPRREWNYHLVESNIEDKESIFSVFCYNILSPQYAKKLMYRYCPNWALDWEHRKVNILSELFYYKSDVICLQEVPMDQFSDYFEPELKAQGYVGIYAPKSRAWTMNLHERKRVDGCAIFYQSSKFDLINQHMIELNQVAQRNSEGCDHMINRVCTRDNIALVALLKTKHLFWDPGENGRMIRHPKLLLVCNTHIHWDPEWCDVKLIQTMLLLNEIQIFCDDYKQSHLGNKSEIHIVLCGDFNSTPNSGVTKYITAGKVRGDHEDFKKLDYHPALSKISSTDLPNEFSHYLNLTTAYNKDDLSFTNFTFDFKQQIDYVFFSQNNLRIAGHLGSISEEWVYDYKIPGLPHIHFSSDHIPLLVQLQFMPRTPSANNIDDKNNSKNSRLSKRF